jgi:hypothetical protein
MELVFAVNRSASWGVESLKGLRNMGASVVGSSRIAIGIQAAFSTLVG